MSAPITTVVGAGIIGTLVAYELAGRAPQPTLTVLDRDGVGAGASRRSAGLHLLRGGTERVREMSRYSAEFYRKLLENQPFLPIYQLPEATVVSSRPAAEALAAYLPEAEPVRLAALPNQQIRLPEQAGRWRIDGCHQADVYGVSLALARELRRRVRYREGVRVTGLEPVADGVRIRLGTGEQLHADQVVLAPGPWLHAPAWRELVAPLGLRVKKIVALHVEQVPGERDRAVIFSDEDAFLIPLVHRGHWLFSYTCPEWDVDPDHLYDGLSAENLEQARQCLRRYSPSLAEDCTSGRVFCDAYSMNAEPQVSRLDDAGRIVFAGAANGSGYRLAPAIAAEAVDLLQLSAEVRSAG
ncbi:MAG TPA: FAD-binding oxidoreductase [Jatrophihabitans sp.]|nr:FAD-binding oxidoreductase [Jatrophihabitans sp.]